MKAKSNVNLSRFGRLAMAAALMIAPAAAAEAVKDRPIDRTVAKLVKQLGDGSFKVREAAQKRLIEIGPPALEQVTKAVKSKDPEVSRRAEEILKVISKQAARRNNEAIKKNLLWKLPLDKPATGALRVSGGVVCLGSDGRTLRAVDVKTGKIIWSDRWDGGRCWTVSGDTLYAPNFKRNLRALDIRSGKSRREFSSQTALGEATVRAGKMYVGGSMRTLWVLDARTGKRLNTFKVSGPVDLAPILRGEKLYFLTRGGKAHALNLKTGKIEWSAKVAKKSLNALASDGGRVYVRADERLLALEAETGKSLWTLPTPGGQLSAGAFVVFLAEGSETLLEDRPLAVAGGAVYLAAGSRILAVDAAKGTKLWEHSPAAKRAEGAPKLNADRLQVVIGGQVRVFVIRAGPGGPRAIMDTHGFHSGWLSPPTVAGGVMYFGSADGLHAVDLKTRGPLWTYRTNAPVTLRPVVVGGVIYFTTAPSPLAVVQPLLGRANVGVQPQGKAAKPSLYALKLKLPPVRTGGR